jgi:small subunit ribosomal protein S8
MIADPISDFIVRLQNASRAGKSSVSLPSSKIKVAVAEVLAREGYLSEVEKPSKVGESLVVSLAFKSGKPAITGVKRLSKASRRMYIGVRDIHPVKRGHGLLLLSTPKGVMTGKEAQEARVGGEVLFEIW